MFCHSLVKSLSEGPCGQYVVKVLCSLITLIELLDCELRLVDTVELLLVAYGIAFHTHTHTHTHTHLVKGITGPNCETAPSMKTKHAGTDHQCRLIRLLKQKVGKFLSATGVQLEVALLSQATLATPCTSAVRP